MRLLRLIIILISLCCGHSLAFGQQTSEKSTIREASQDLIEDVMSEIDAELGGQEELFVEVESYKDEVDHLIDGLLSALTRIIKDYSLAEDNLAQSSRQVWKDVENLQSELEKIPEMFPKQNILRPIVEPHVHQFLTSIDSEFPELKPPPNEGNPLGHYYEYYKEAEAENAFGMARFYRIEGLVPEIRHRIEKEKILELTEAGIENDETIFREIREYVNGRLTYKVIIKNDEIVEEFYAEKDFSIYHGLPAQMRAEGLNESVIRLVEECVKLVNFHLIRAYMEEGLILDVGHSQLDLPPDYTPSEFVKNFITILLEIAEPFQSTS